MAKHARKVFRPTYKTLAISLAGAPVERQQIVLEGVDGDNAGGTLIRNLHWSAVLGNVDTADALINSDLSAGHMGFFKWPIDAAAPSVTTLDYENRASVFGRTTWVAVGVDSHRVSGRIKTITLRPGEQLFSYWYKQFDSATVIDAHGMCVYQYWVNKD